MFFDDSNECYLYASEGIEVGRNIYKRIILLVIPSWLLNPWEKPLQILCEFRNICFSAEATRGFYR